MNINLPDKSYYKIGEVSRAFDVNPSLIRFWEKEFEIINPKKGARGSRLFTKKDIKNLQLVYNLVKEKGYTLEGAKTRLQNSNGKVANHHEVIITLEGVKQELLKIKNQLK
ncbi:MAG: MerR family transcriptional regulator [Flavobacteriaceae bacterium]|nr:MerR family transcriptional regulator [Flavobacteriaceae bacterium]